MSRYGGVLFSRRAIHDRARVTIAVKKSCHIGVDEIVGVIPARWGSTRFPGKSLTPIAGRPLIDWVIRGCRRSKRVTRWIVATDDRRIAAAAQSAGAEVHMTSSRLQTGTDRVAQVARRVRASWILNWQGDEWLADGRPVDLLISALEKDPGCEVATLARSLDLHLAKNANRVKVVLSQLRRALYFSRASIPYRRAGTEPYRLHLGAYLFSRELLLKFARWPRTPLEKAEQLEQLRLLEHDVPIAVAPCRIMTWGVDTLKDAKELGRLIARGRL